VTLTPAMVDMIVAEFVDSYRKQPSPFLDEELKVACLELHLSDPERTIRQAFYEGHKRRYVGRAATFVRSVLETARRWFPRIFSASPS
jgi:hypothetical protein